MRASSDGWSVTVRAIVSRAHSATLRLLGRYEETRMRIEGAVRVKDSFVIDYLTIA